MPSLLLEPHCDYSITQSIISWSYVFCVFFYAAFELRFARGQSDATVTSDLRRHTHPLYTYTPPDICRGRHEEEGQTLNTNPTGCTLSPFILFLATGLCMPFQNNNNNKDLCLIIWSVWKCVIRPSTATRSELTRFSPLPHVNLPQHPETQRGAFKSTGGLHPSRRCCNQNGRIMKNGGCQKKVARCAGCCWVSERETTSTLSKAFLSLHLRTQCKRKLLA